MPMKKDKLSELIKEFKLSQLFQEKTKIIEFTKQHSYDDLMKVHFKSYPRFDKVKLSKKIEKSKISLEEVITKRKSFREFKGKPISKEEISKLLFLSAGIKEMRKNAATELRYSLEYPFTIQEVPVENVKDVWDTSRRSYPSAGARYPLEIYPVILRSDEIKPGIYHYNVKEHTLELIKTGDFGDLMTELCNGQKWVKDASIVLLISAVFSRTQNKYGDRGYRYILFDAGHLGQNIYLTVNSMNLGCCAIGGFKDDEINELLRLNFIEESVIYIFCIGEV